MDRTLTFKTKSLLIAWCIFLLITELVGARLASAGVHSQFDFEEYYTAGYLLRTHPSQIYDLAQQESVQYAHAPNSSFLPFYHPEYEAILYAPLSLLSYRAAYLSYIACNAFLVLAVLFVLQRNLSDLPWQEQRPWRIFSSSFPYRSLW